MKYGNIFHNNYEILKGDELKHTIISLSLICLKNVTIKVMFNSYSKIMKIKVIENRTVKKYKSLMNLEIKCYFYRLIDECIQQKNECY